VTKKYLKVGVIGVGRMGQNHCRVYSGLPRAELAGIYDLDSQVGKVIARKFGAPYFSQLDDLLLNVDAISLATPTPQHYDLALHCLAHGVHLMIEKPIADTLEQADALTLSAEQSGLVVQVGHIERFNPTYHELKNVLESLTVLAINIRRLSAYEGSNKDVDVILDLMIHDTDLVCDLVGKEPASISAHGLTVSNRAIDHAIAQLTYESGPLLTLTASRVTELKVRSIEVTALEAFLECDLLNKTISVHRRTRGEYLNNNLQGVKYRQESIVERIHVPAYEPLYMELQHFVDCILDGIPPMVPARDGLKALRLAENIRQAIKEQPVLRVDQTPAPKQAVPAAFLP